MAKQVQVLRAIADAREPINISGICVALKINAADRKNRKGVIKAVGGLVSRDLVVRMRPKQKSFEPPMPKYQVAKAGRDLLRKGGTIDSGPRGKHTGCPAAKPTTLRARLWTALRIKGKATIAELIELSLKQGEDDVTAADNARKYLKALARAGFVVEMATPKKTPGASRYKRFALVKDVGPDAPVPCKAFIYDPNAKHATPARPDRIPYPDPTSEAA